MPYSENYIDSFLNQAVKAIKTAQQTEQPNISQKQLQSTALKLVENLKQSYSPITIEGDAQMFQKNVFNLGALLLWLADNKVKVDGHRVVYLNPSPSNTSPNGPKSILPPTTVVKDEVDKQIRYLGKPGEPTVWREGLIEFLKTLRKQAASSNNLYFEELVAKCIEDANTNPSYDTGLDANEQKPQSPQHAPNDFSDVEAKPDTVIDMISSRINPMHDIAEDTQVRVSDLNSSNFPAFINKLYFSTDGTNKGYVIANWQAEDSDVVCKVLNYLYDRATDKYNANKKNRASQYYLAQIYKFMGQKHCVISSKQNAAPDKQHGNAEEVSYKTTSIQTTLEQTGGSSNLVLPFELTTDLISLDRFRQFILQVSGLLSNAAFVSEMGTFINVLRTQAYTTNGGLLNFQQQASGTAAVDGGFSLSTNTNVDQFVNTFANGDFAKARNLLLVLSPICTELSGMLKVLQASPSLTENVGEDVLRSQVQRGQDYVNRIGGFVSQIGNFVGHH